MASLISGEKELITAFSIRLGAGLPHHPIFHRIKRPYIAGAVDQARPKEELCTRNQALQPEVAPRDPPVRLRKSVQDVWLEVSIVEGKNRQLRKMTAAIGHPTLRLLRQSMANLTLEGLAPGQSREIGRGDIAF